MMEENNDIFLAGGDALVYLAESMQKQYSRKFIWGHPFGTYVSYDRFFNSPLPYAPLHILYDSPPFPQFCSYLMGSLCLNQKRNNNIRISYSPKYKHSEKNKLFRSHTRPKILHLISVTLSHINDIIIVHFKPYSSQCFPALSKSFLATKE